MKHLIIYNPAAGTAAGTLEAVKTAFEGLDYEVYETTGPKSAIKYLKEYFQKNTKDTVRVYACGGDGTLHECVNALVGVKNAELTLYATGTGNDFTKVYGGKATFCNLNRLINGKICKIDLSKIEGDSLNEPLYSINVINFGFDAIVGAMGNYYKEHGIPADAKGTEKTNPYDYALKHDAMKHGRFNDTVVYADGEQLNKKQILLCTLAQGQYVGGHFHCAPKSINNDGLIDVCVFKTMTLLGLGLIIGTYTNGHHLDKPRRKIVYRQAKEIKFVAPKEIDVCVDGEMIKGKEFKVSILPAAINFVIPQE